ncbi:MAG: hypothetical protein ACI4D6_05095 [Chordicoccus sp.]
MLSRLIGYEMKAFGRILLPIYAVALVISLLVGLDLNMVSKASESAAGTFLILFLVLLIMAIFIVTIVLSVGRFYTNLLGREGYLMFSLPTGTGTLIWAKVISSLIWSFFSTVAAAVAVAIPMLAAPGTISDIADMGRQGAWDILMKEIAPYRVNIILAVLLVIALLTYNIVNIYAAIAIGHLWSDHRIIGSALAYIAMGIIEMILFGAAGNTIFQSDKWGDLSQAMTVTGTEVAAIVVCLIGIAVYGFITWILLDRKLNLE